MSQSCGGLGSRMRSSAGNASFALALKGAATPLLRSPSQLALDVLQRRVIPQFSGEEVGRLVNTLSYGGVDCCLAGGWGVDALVGTTLRFHRDIDLVLLQFDRDVVTATEILRNIGFEAAEAHPAGMWMPRALSFRDGSGRSVELLDLDESLVFEAIGFLGSHDGAPLRRQLVLVTTGKLAGMGVACLTRDAQLVLHSGYPLRPEDRRTLKRLGWSNRVIGRWYGGPAPAIRPDLPWRGDGADRDRDAERTGELPLSLIVPVLDAPHRAVMAYNAVAEVPLHILLGPVATRARDMDDASIAEINDIAGRLPAFRFTLRPGRGQRAVSLMLGTEPVEAFQSMQRAFGLPVEGSSGHSVTADRGTLPTVIASRLLSLALPFESEAREVWLMTTPSRRRWRLIRAFRLRPAVDTARTTA